MYSVPVELVLSLITMLSAVAVAIYSVRASLLRTRVEMKIRDTLDSIASKDRRFNGIIRDANSSFMDGSDSITNDEVHEFRRMLSSKVAEELNIEEKVILKSITDRSDNLLERYGERMAHSIAGRRTFWGRLIDRYIKILLRLVS